MNLVQNWVNQIEHGWVKVSKNRNSFVLKKGDSSSLRRGAVDGLGASACPRGTQRNGFRDFQAGATATRLWILSIYTNMKCGMNTRLLSLFDTRFPSSARLGWFQVFQKVVGFSTLSGTWPTVCFSCWVTARWSSCCFPSAPRAAEPRPCGCWRPWRRCQRPRRSRGVGAPAWPCAWRA